MEPRSVERGNAHFFIASVAAPCFNGATFCPTRKPLTGVIRHRRHRPRFNGATLSRTWKHAYRQPAERYPLPASMGPRPVERGNQEEGSNLPQQPTLLQWGHAQSNVETTRATRLRTARRCFNGATLSRTWKRRGVRAGHPRTSGFNGATLSRTWKLAGAYAATTATLALQWSHAQSNVETVWLAWRSRSRAGLQWSHAQSNVET